jgi:hypothetical protein
MSYTTEDLATEVMRLPGWLDAHETPDSADAAYITRVYSGYYAEWVIREIAYWPEAVIPEEVFWHIVRIVADSVAPSFGDAAPTEFDIESGQQVSMGMKGWRALKRVKSVEPSGQTTQSAYF